MSDDYHVILPSSTDNSNTANHYVTTMDKHIDLSNRNWRVGLTDISFYKNNVTATKGGGYEIIIDDFHYDETRCVLYPIVDSTIEQHYIIFADEKFLYVARDYCDHTTLKEFTIKFDCSLDYVKHGYTVLIN